MVTPVVLLAHGSRHPEADAAVARIADAVSALTGAPAHPSYLDFSPLTLTTVAHLLAAEGYRRATVVPLLFTRAFHMRHDVPEALAEATAATGVEFTLADGIGTGADVAELLASRIPPGTGHLVLYSVGSSVSGANETVADLAIDSGGRAGITAELVTATGPSGGVDALVDAVRRATGPVHVAPLFISPGTLWDAAVDVLSSLPDNLSVTTGVPLDTAVAPLTAHRARERNAG
jgi:sirohydrochlorin ferrochelatase